MRSLYPNPILIAVFVGLALLLSPATAMAVSCGDDAAGTVCEGGGFCDGAGEADGADGTAGEDGTTGGAGGAASAPAVEEGPGGDEPPTLAERERVCRARNALVALDQMCIAVSPATVAAVYLASVAANIPPKAMLLPHVLPELCRAALPAAHSAQQEQEQEGD